MPRAMPWKQHCCSRVGQLSINQKLSQVQPITQKIEQVHLLITQPKRKSFLPLCVSSSIGDIFDSARLCCFKRVILHLGYKSPTSLSFKETILPRGTHTLPVSYYRFPQYAHSPIHASAVRIQFALQHSVKYALPIIPALHPAIQPASKLQLHGQLQLTTQQANKQAKFLTNLKSSLQRTI